MNDHDQEDMSEHNGDDEAELEVQTGDDELVSFRDASTNAPVEAMGAKEADAEAFNALFAASTRSGPGAMSGGSTVKRRTISFTLDGGVGMLRPDGAPVFSDEDGNVLDLPIVMHSLTVGEEHAVVKRCVQNPGLMPYEQAKRAIRKVAGVTINEAKREWLWEALGPGGRQVCVVAYNMIGGASASVLGKYRASMSIG